MTVDPAVEAIVRRLLDVFNGADPEVLESLVADDFVDHSPIPGQAPGRAGMRQKATSYRAALPDAWTVVEEVRPTHELGVVQATWVTIEGPASPHPPACRYTALLSITGGRLRESRMLQMQRIAPPSD